MTGQSEAYKFSPEKMDRGKGGVPLQPSQGRRDQSVAFSVLVISSKYAWDSYCV